MKKKTGLKAVLASALVSLALAGPAMVFSASTTTVAQICVEGAELRSVTAANGEVTFQAIFDVSIDQVSNATGASFFLEYNDDYLEPSDMDTNEVLHPSNVEARCSDFFEADPELYYIEDSAGNKTPVDPFTRNPEEFSQLDTDLHYIFMNLWLNQDGDQVADSIITTTGGVSGTTLANGDKIGGKISLLQRVGYGGVGQQDNQAYVFNLWDDPEEVDETDCIEKVTLGQLSFQVKKEHLAEMIDYFNGLAVDHDNQPGTGAIRPLVQTKSLNGANYDTFLLEISRQYGQERDPWTVGHFKITVNDDRGDRPVILKDFETLKPAVNAAAGLSTTMVDSYRFEFDPKQIIWVEATEPEVTVNAYQNFTKGNRDDLPITMGKYSPTVTVTYADGSKENIPFPWGRTTAKDAYTVKQTPNYTNADVNAWVLANPGMTAADCPYQVGELNSAGTAQSVTAANYDPTHGVYTFTQNYVWTDTAGTHVFSVPVTAKLTVTPITVIDVTAEDLERSYNVVDVVDQVTSGASLALPQEARIVTDIVPGGVSLTTPIKGWKPVQPASALVDPDGTANSGDEYYDTVSTWPGVVTHSPGPDGVLGTADDVPIPSTKQMNSLKADSYDRTSGDPYWPDVADRTATQDTAQQSHFIGRYTFETAKGNYTDQEDILSADIKAAYPWLTIPFQPGSNRDRVKTWDVGEAHRTILGEEDFKKVDPAGYEVDWEYTVTETAGNGQQAPNDKHANGVGQPTLRLSVSKKAGAGADEYGAMSADSVFRVWLPNGQEVGTGLNAGGVAVDNWFGDPASADPTVHVNGFYDGSKFANRSGTNRYFFLDMNPDQPEVNDHGTERETLRRYINLGGWYHVAVCEDPGNGNHWTEPMPVYVPPRRNEYTEDKIYNFLGDNAGLYNWPGGIGDTLYLPRGRYEVVGPLDTTGGSYTAGVGLPLYLLPNSLTPTDGIKDTGSVFEAGNLHRVLPNVTRYTESYGVQTIYDGQTGAQPGEVFNVKVDRTHTSGGALTWPLPGGRMVAAGQPDRLTHATVGGNQVYKYGPTPLYEGADADGDGKRDGYAVAAFGRVFQPEADPDKYTATVRREAAEKPAETVRIKLLSWDVDGITRTPLNSTDFDNDNVVLVTYDTKQEGYTVRQDFTLTVKNVGTTDIYGLDIDTLTDDYDLDDGFDAAGKPCRTGGHFEMLKPPASFLPVGESTTFTLTYVYDLDANVAPNALRYRDKLYITANGHDNPGIGNQHDTGLMSDEYLLDFDAEFVVSKSPLHKVTVIYRPDNGNMGTANLIVGEQSTATSAVSMIYTPTTRTYPKDGLVYVVVNKVDEYEVHGITAQINGSPVNLLANNAYGPGLFTGVTGYYGTATVDDDKEVYVFQMPDHDVTVYVDFWEPFHSKLRLENLIDFSSPPDPEDGSQTINDLRTAPTKVFAAEPPDAATHQYRIWRKTFSKEELAAAKKWSEDAGGTSVDQDYYLMTQGTAIPHAPGWPNDPVPASEGQQFISKENQYLVVIDPEDDISQVEAQIRRVVYHEDYQGVNPLNSPNGYNYEIEMEIGMEVYPYGVEAGDPGNYNWGKPGYTSTTIYDPDTTSDPNPDNRVGYGTDPAFTGNPRRVYTDPTTYTTTGDTSLGAYPPADGSSNSSIHTSIQFPSPKKGESSYAVITLRAYNPDAGYQRIDERRYYLEIHRRTEKPDVELNYGNSPYGMIMNQSRWDKDEKADAKEKFLKGYTFEGLPRRYVPDVIWETDKHPDNAAMQHTVYWREAWVRNRAVFEPESLTGFTPDRHGDGHQKFYDEDPDDHDNPNNPANVKTKPIYTADKRVYVEAENLDLNDYAYFAILGEKMREPGILSAKDSSGRAVKVSDIRAVAMDVDWETNGRGVTLLDTTKTKQVERFQGAAANYPIIDLGTQGSTFEPLAEHQPAPPATALTVTDKHWPASSKEVTTTPKEGGEPVTTTEYTLIEDIRPGRYAIVYSYTDFDGTTVLKVDRPFVILRAVGDVNTDGVRDNVRSAADAAAAAKTDEYHLEDRVGTDPLGYEAGLAPTAVEPYGADYPFANIFKFRVCDVNNDRNINHIDANQLDKNVRQNSGWIRFYHPWDYGLN